MLATALVVRALVVLEPLSYFPSAGIVARRLAIPAAIVLVSVGVGLLASLFSG